MDQSSKKPEAQKVLRVCYFGTYREKYSRNRIMIKGLQQNGVQVYTCHEPLWLDASDRVEVANFGWLRPTFWFRTFRSYSRLLRKLHDTGGFDILIVGYPGPLDLFPAKIISWVRKIPLCWDMFMSIYLISKERELHLWNQRAIHLLEKIACKLPDMIIIDTEEYATWLRNEYAIRNKHIRLVPTGADDHHFRLSNELKKSQKKTLNIIYYGTFIPNHGLEYVISAAHLLSHHDVIKFVLIGDGPEKQKIEDLIKLYNLKNVRLENWMSEEMLVNHIQESDILLGSFGKTPQSKMTIQNKIYQGLAMRKAIITGDSRPVRRSLKNGIHIMTCERASPEALARTIEMLWKDPGLRKRIAQQGHLLFKEQYTSLHIGRIFREYLEELKSG